MTTLSLTPELTNQAPSVGIGSDALVSRFCCIAAEKIHHWTNPNAELSAFCGKCAVCGCDERYTYHVPESLWRRVLPEQLWNEIVCAKCFHEAAMISANIADEPRSHE